MAEMREGMALLRSQQHGTFMPLLMTLLAETEAEAGRPEAALAIVDEQLAIARADWTALVSGRTPSSARRNPAQASPMR